jgi:hypothetical protein
MDKFTLFELHVHDGMEFSATNTAPAIGRSADDEAYEELEEELEEIVEGADDSDESADDSDERTADDSDGGVAPFKLLAGLVVLAVVAVAIRKLRGGDAELEIAELDDLTEEDEEEAEI